MARHSLDAFKSAKNKQRSSDYYKTFTYPEYETICWKLNKYLERPPTEILENMTCYSKDRYDANTKELYRALKIFQAIEKGDLATLQTLGWISFYKDSLMQTALKYRQIHIVEYLYNANDARYYNFPKVFEIQDYFPVMRDLVELKTKALEEEKIRLEKENKKMRETISQAKALFY